MLGSKTTQPNRPDLSVLGSYGPNKLSFRCEPVKEEDRQGLEHLSVSGLISSKLRRNRLFTPFLSLMKCWLYVGAGHFS